MNPLTNTRNITKLNERELSLGISERSSWHNEYKDSAWIFVGGLSYDLTEGDLLCVFSQYGEIVNINLVRDKKTGKTLGYGFLCYEDQRSTVLAVDNLNGIKVCGRIIRVDHVNNYRMPKQDTDIDPMTQAIREKGCAPAIMPDIAKLASGLAEEDAANRTIKLEVIDLEMLPDTQTDSRDSELRRNRSQLSSANSDRRLGDFVHPHKDWSRDVKKEERSRDNRQRTPDHGRDRGSKKSRTRDEIDKDVQTSGKNGIETEKNDTGRRTQSKRSTSPGSDGELQERQTIKHTSGRSEEKKQRRSRDRSVEKERRHRSRENSPAKAKKHRRQETSTDKEKKHGSNESGSQSHRMRNQSPEKEFQHTHRKHSKKQKHKSRRKSSSEDSASDKDSSSPEPPPSKSSSKKHLKHKH